MVISNLITKIYWSIKKPFLFFSFSFTTVNNKITCLQKTFFILMKKAISNIFKKRIFTKLPATIIYSSTSLQSFQVLLKSLFGVLFTVRSFYLSAIGLMSILILTKSTTRIFKFQFHGILLNKTLVFFYITKQWKTQWQHTNKGL